MTFLDMWKLHLITKETAENFSRGIIKAKNGQIIECITNDLETFFSKSRIRIDFSLTGNFYKRTISFAFNNF